MKPTTASVDDVSERENAEEGTNITVLHRLQCLEMEIKCK